MNEKHPLDEHFRKTLKSHKIEPRASVWDKIETHTTVKQGKKGSMYILRAAAVTLLIGLSAVFYYQNNNMVSNIGPGTDKNKDGITTEKNVKAGDNKSKENKPGEDRQKAKSKSDKVVPIMRQKIGSQPTVVVSNHNLPDIVDEELLLADEPFVLQTLTLDVLSEEVKPNIKIRVKIKAPATTPAFYTASNTSKNEKTDLKEMVYTYAGNQLENVINGKPLEWPQSPEKPQLEIDLSKIFN